MIKSLRLLLAEWLIEKAIFIMPKISVERLTMLAVMQSYYQIVFRYERNRGER